MSAAATDDEAIGRLVDRLASAHAAAAGLAGRPPLGVRAVEPAEGRRSYLAAFEGPAFLCLTGDLAAEIDERRAREAASASLLWETVEALVDAAALRELARAVGGFLALGGDPAAVAQALEVVAMRALELAAWREAPLRALASLPALDEGVALQERLVGAYALLREGIRTPGRRAGHPDPRDPSRRCRRSRRVPGGPAPPSGSPIGWRGRCPSARTAPRRCWRRTSPAFARPARRERLRHRGLLPSRARTASRRPGRSRAGWPRPRTAAVATCSSSTPGPASTVALPSGTGTRMPIGFTRRPETAEEISGLASRLGKEPRIRVYAMEETA